MRPPRVSAGLPSRSSPAGGAGAACAAGWPQHPRCVTRAPPAPRRASQNFMLVRCHFLPTRAARPPVAVMCAASSERPTILVAEKLGDAGARAEWRLPNPRHSLSRAGRRSGAAEAVRECGLQLRPDAGATVRQDQPGGCADRPQRHQGSRLPQGSLTALRGPSYGNLLPR